MSNFTLTNEFPNDPKPGNVHLTFSSPAAARFELIVDESGHVHLYGYSGTAGDDDQSPNLVFDTDGSFGVFTDEEA